MSSAISVHHVGGRDGDFPFNPANRFLGDLDVTLYEVDDEAVADGAAELGARGIRHRFLPHALWSEAAELPLHVTFCPYGTSLLDFNHNSPTIVETVRGADYIHDETLSSVKVVTTKTNTLDAICQAEGGPEAPDFLSMDTQGAELEILKGGADVVKNNVLGIVAELALIDSYAGQPLISDICRYLETGGFFFVRFIDLHNAHCYRAPIGMRAGACTYESNGLFLRRLDRLEGLSEASLRKLAFIAAHFGHIDYMVAVIEQLGSDENPGAAEYAGFVDAARSAIGAMPAVLPWKYTEVYSAEEARDLTPSSPPTENQARRAQEYIAAHPELVGGLQALSSQDDSPLESCLRAYEMAGQADVTKAERLKNVARFAHSLRIIE